MKIEPQDSGDLHIWMTDDELCRFGLCLEDIRAGTPTANRAIRRLLKLARQRIPFPSAGRISVEVMPFHGGCVFAFIAPVLPLTKTDKPILYTFDAAETLLQFAEALATLPSTAMPWASLYRRGEEYVLIVFADGRPSSHCYALFKEFATPLGEGYPVAAYIEEYATVLAVGDALIRLRAVYESPQPTPPHRVR